MKTDQQTKEYYAERLDSSNLADVEKLHASVYGRMPLPGLFLKKYDTSFTGAAYIGFIAYSKEEIPIAFYGVTPCFICIGDKIVLSAQSADTMTHPQYRNKGLFVELASLTFQLCRKEGIQLIFGFPNQNSLHGFINKLGWEMTERMDCFIIPAGGFPWVRLLRKLPILKNRQLQRRQKQLEKYRATQQGVGNSVLEDGFAGVCRDDHFRNYKTYTRTYTIKISNSILWIKISGVLLIGDISVIPADFDYVIAELKKLARNIGLKEIHFHASPGTTLYGLFAKSFKSIPSFPVIFKNLAGDSPIDKIKFTSADIDTF
jgi:GNAT superfamily N-acetyltransferase